MMLRPLRLSSLLCLGVLTFAAGCASEIPKEVAKSPDKAAVPEAGGAKATKRIIILTNGNSPYWDACRAGVQDANTQLKLADAGLVAEMEVNDGTPQGQIDKLRQYGSQSDIAAVGVSAIDASNAAVADELRNLQKKGVAVVTIDSDLDREKFRDARTAFVGTDNLAGGKVLGMCAAALKPDGGEYVTFVGRTGAQNAIERIGGFGEGAGPKFAAKDSMGDDLDRTRAKDNVRNAIGNHPQLNTLVGIWSYNAPAIVDVVRELKARDKYSIVVFDAEPSTIQAMADGDVDVMVVQDPYRMGFDGVKLLKAIIQKDDATQNALISEFVKGMDILDTGLKVVVPNDASPITKLKLGEGVKVHTLSDFKAWLEKYGLAGS